MENSACKEMLAAPFLCSCDRVDSEIHFSHNFPTFLFVSGINCVSSWSCRYVSQLEEDEEGCDSRLAVLCDFQSTAVLSVLAQLPLHGASVKTSNSDAI